MSDLDDASALDDARVRDLMSTMLGLAKQLQHAFASQPSPVPGVETTQLALLMKLGHEALSVGRLAELVHSDTSTVSRQVNRLASLGFVAKVAAEHDRRVQLLSLTERGESVRQEILAHRTMLFEDFLDGFTPDDLASLDDLLQRLSAGVARHLDTPA